MEEEKIAVINLYSTESKVLNINYRSGVTTIDDLCVKICKILNIGPVARHLFLLRNENPKFWYHPGHVLDDKEKYRLKFQLRFKPASLQRLKQIDVNAYDYYYLQVRYDVWDCNVPDINYKQREKELFGLGVTDMYRVMKEKNISQEEVMADYKKYIPKECSKNHPFLFIKKPIRQCLKDISEPNVAIVKELYLKQFEEMAPKYPTEEYEAFMAKDSPSSACKIKLKVNSEGINYREIDSTRDWELLCTIEDLCFVTIRHVHVVEISRKNGIPSYLKFTSKPLVLSFVSILDGYYRLTFKWIFNLCGDVVTPSLESLYKLKCHGPVGGEFSYAKLKEKRDNRPGTYILRESETVYDSFYLDNCGSDGKPWTYKIDKLNSGEFRLADSGIVFKSFRDIVIEYQDVSDTRKMYLRECLPPSEFDKSPLLICAPEIIGTEVTADVNIITTILSAEPRIIPPDQLQVYEGQPFTKTSERNTLDLLKPNTPLTLVYRAMWRAVKGKKMEVAIRFFKGQDNHVKDFLCMAGNWSKIRSSNLVRLFGLTIGTSISMVVELVKLGPLDAYLRNAPPNTIKTVDLVQAASCLASALWHLEECGIIHGNIRCRKLLVHAHTEDNFIVKLTDPGLFCYNRNDVHWVPPECYQDFDSARWSPMADVWALATTLWQIFSRGATFPQEDISVTMQLYMAGRRMPKPPGCPQEVYNLILDCWGDSGGSRKQPQAIMRDVHRILSQVFESERSHSYATAFPKLVNENEANQGLMEFPEAKEQMKLNTANPNANAFWLEKAKPVENVAATSPRETRAENFQQLRPVPETVKVTPPKNNNNGDGFQRFESIYELYKNCNVILKRKIGQGFYGEVFLGIMEKTANICPIQVAVKKLKKVSETELELIDFEREIKIMKALKHPNIVSILGVIEEPEISLVMEYVEHGSLQSYVSINREHLTHHDMLSFALDIARGMQYLGTQKIVHRDLAARNVLVTDDNKGKISDFGLAQVKEDNDYYILKTSREIPIKWYAPECLLGGKFSSKSDVWSYGVTLYEMFSYGEDPKICVNRKEASTAVEMYTALEEGVRLSCPINCPHSVYANIMAPCWDFDSHKRPNFGKICLDLEIQLG